MLRVYPPAFRATHLAFTLALIALSSGCRDRAPEAGPKAPADAPSSAVLTPRDAAVASASAASLASAPATTRKILVPDDPMGSAFAAEKVTGEAHAMGTHLSYAAFSTPQVSGDRVRAAFDAATAEIQRLEALMTTWRPDSDVSRINAAAGASGVVVSPETYAVIEESIHASERSEGTFDITFETLHGLWKFDEDLDPHPPTDAQIQAKLPLLGYRHIKLDAQKHSVFIDQAGTRIGLGGIAKGYAVDRAAQTLLSAGINAFYVQAGGDLFTHGRKPDGSEWIAGIRDPRGAEGDFFAMISVTDHSFSTAGDYERSYIVGGTRYHHIIDPRTGKPATASRSVTIWAPTAFLADAVDDAVFILGPEKGLKLVESLDGVGAVIVDAHNNVVISKRLEGKVKVVHPPTGGI